MEKEVLDYLKKRKYLKNENSFLKSSFEEGILKSNQHLKFLFSTIHVGSFWISSDFNFLLMRQSFWPTPDKNMFQENIPKMEVKQNNT